MPKMTTFRKWQYRAKLNNYRVVPVPNTSPPLTTTEFFYVRDIVFDVVQGMFGKITVALPDNSVDIMQGARLLELRDNEGSEIYPNGIWELSEIMPIFYLGRREGFRASAKLIGATNTALAAITNALSDA